MEEETKKKGKRGRPENFIGKRRGYGTGIPRWLDLEVIERHAKAGLTMHQMALCLRCNVDTFRKYRRHEKWGPLIEQALQKGEKAANEKVERSLFRSAVGFVRETVKEEEKLTKDGRKIKCKTRITEEFAPNPVAGMMWLSNKDADNWKNRQDSNITQQVRTVPVELKNLDKQGMTDVLLKFKQERAKRKGDALVEVRPEQAG